MPFPIILVQCTFACGARIVGIKPIEEFVPPPALRLVAARESCSRIFAVTAPNPTERIRDVQQFGKRGIVVDTAAESTVIDRLRRTGQRDPVAACHDHRLAPTIRIGGPAALRMIGHRVVTVVRLLAPIGERTRLPDHDVEGRFVVPLRQQDTFETERIADFQAVDTAAQLERLHA